LVYYSGFWSLYFYKNSTPYLLNKFLLYSYFLLLITGTGYSQNSLQNKKQDSIKKESPFETGIFPIWIFDLGMRSVVRYNDHEGIRLGIGGITNDKLFEKLKFGGYFAYGIRDHESKFSIGGSVRLNKPNKLWLDFYYTDDIREFGDYTILTDKLVFSIIEPRLLNITQFYKHTSWRSSLNYYFNTKLIAEVQIAKRKISQIENYQFITDGIEYSEYTLSEASISVRYGINNQKPVVKEYYNGGLPSVSFQVTQGFKNIFGSDFNYTKLGVKATYFFKRKNLSSTSLLVVGSLALGDVPLTHLFHTSPNSPTKDVILQRFSVAGRNSFETMYFGEFFSNKYTALHLKHSLFRLHISKKIQPEAIAFTRHAIGDLKDKDKHLGVNFNTLNQIYSESGIELNRILYGFGLSFTYRYGYYHLPNFEDNISFKFTFYLKL